MFFARLLHRSFTRQLWRRSLVGLTVALCASISVAMLGVVLDVGDKLNAELTAYGSNIVVQPKADAVVSSLYETEETTEATAFIDEAEVPNIKTIFWAYNIVDFAAELTGRVDVASASAQAQDLAITGTWFDKELNLSTGQTTTAGVTTLRSWWTLEGAWPADDADEAVVGSTLAQRLGVTTGDTLTLSTATGERALTVTGVYTSGDDDDDSLYAPLAVVQELTGHVGQVDEVEVKALTTPENDLSRKAARNPNVLSASEWETWYCTAYASSITYQIEEVMPGAVAKQVRQVAAVEGKVLEKTQALMILMTALSLVAAVIAVASLTNASLVERTSEFALLKAVGASSASINRLILAETAVIGVIGTAVGAAAGSGIAQLIGRVVFGSSITMRPMVYVLVAVLVALVLVIATASSMRTILRIQPATALHKR
ncbi:ABC transporter permease [Actinomyces succiniciruminis]|uniref:Possible permease protein of ABC transporter system n=1 Tax=Actinomyces succiniciruminis TaxID=1522002 RepID=A0A1L7RIA2_9ACTO|nr:ABC transporter permease [Actinomyces succiniciruminis]CED91486.1 Possible permease protein of ABC transporter system [Actinomyces succiniciruminis]